jgi:hypothetical protein
MAVRCVPVPVIDTRKHRIDAPPGMLGVGDVSGELTLKGSNRYNGDSSSSDPFFKGNAAVKGTADERVWLVQFKPGSLVALYGGMEEHQAAASLDASNMTYARNVSKDDIAWVPQGFGGGTLESFKNDIGIKTGSAAWGTITEWNSSGFPSNTSDYIAIGQGDPCAFADSPTGNSGYMMPSANIGASTWNGRSYTTTNTVEATINGIKGRYNSTNKEFFPYDGTYGANTSYARYYGAGAMLIVGSKTTESTSGGMDMRVLQGGIPILGITNLSQSIQTSSRYQSGGSGVLSTNIRCIPVPWITNFKYWVEDYHGLQWYRAAWDTTVSGLTARIYNSSGNSISAEISVPSNESNFQVGLSAGEGSRIVFSAPGRQSVSFTLTTPLVAGSVGLAPVIPPAVWE